MLNRLWRFVESWRGRLFGRPFLYRSCHVRDAPDALDPGKIYIVGADGYDWSALMRCPGRCGKTLEMNLLPTAEPVWKITEHQDGTASLHPSVWLKTGCRCHFVLRQGHIRWV
jgi:hypothetical protein